MHRLILCLSILSLGISAQSQTAQNPIRSLLHGRVTLDAESGCLGCDKPDSWTPKESFALGQKVWVKVKLVNHTRRDVVMATDLRFDFMATDSEGKELRFTDSRCLRECSCYQTADGKVHRYGEPPIDPKAPPCVFMITAARPPELDVMKPGKSIEATLEITGDYEISKAGDFRIAVSVGDLWLARKRDIPANCQLCEASSIRGAKSLGGLSATKIAIHVAP